MAKRKPNTMTQYLEDSGRTAAGTFHANKVSPRYVAKSLLEAMTVSVAVDQIKKALFYGKDNCLWTHGAMIETPGVNYSDIDIDILHAVLGIYTEAAEMVELLLQSILSGEPLNEKKFKDEAGDNLWYLAMLFRSLGTTFEEVSELNIEKLRVRFPDRFEAGLAISKDDVAEAGVFAK